MKAFGLVALRLWAGLSRGVEILLVAVTLAMIATALAQVFSRYVLHAPLVWSEELSRYLFIWLAFLAAWRAWRRREHIGISLWPQHMMNWLMRLTEVLIAGFALVSMIYGLRLMGLARTQPSAALQLPMVWVYAAFYAGMGLILLETLAGWLRLALRHAGEARA